MGLNCKISFIDEKEELAVKTRVSDKVVNMAKQEAVVVDMVMDIHTVKYYKDLVIMADMAHKVAD